MRSVGIDIGRHSIKVVEASFSNHTYRLIKAREYKVLNPESSSQEIDILQGLKQISKDFHIESAKVTTSVRQHFISNRKLFFPFREKIKIQKSLAFELEDHLPLSVDKTIYDSRIIRYKGSSAEVIAMACVMDEVEKTINLFNRCHIDPDIVTPEISAIANLYEKWSQPPKEMTTDEHLPDKLIVHLGHSRTLVGLVNQGYLVWGRNIMWGAEKIATSISQSLHIPSLEALEMMPTKALILLSLQDASFEEKKISDAITTALDPLIQSLRLTLITSSVEYNCKVENIELLGGVSGVKNIAPFITKALEKPTKLVNPLDKGTGEFQHQKQMGHVFHMALGLAIEGLKRPNNPPINFRQMQFAKKNKTFEKLWNKWGYTGKLLATTYLIYLIYGLGMNHLSTHLKEVSNNTLVSQADQVAGLTEANATPSKIKKFIETNNRKVKVMEVYRKLEKIQSPVELIHSISQSLPSNEKNKSYEVRKLIVKNNKVDIQGTARSQKIIDNLSEVLKKLAIKNKVLNIPITIEKEDGKKSFAFSFKVERKN